MTVESLFVTAAAARLRYSMRQLAECLGKLSEDQVWARGHESENAVGNLALHLAGNVRQWIIAGLGGRPDIRVRDREFSTQGGIAPAELATRLGDIVEEAASVIEGLTADRLTQIFTIQGGTVAGLDAVLQVIGHFAQHTGQIIFVTKNLTHAP